MSSTSEVRPRRGVPVGIMVVCLLVAAGAGVGVGWLLHPEPEPEAAAAAQQLASIVHGSHPGMGQVDDARAAAALYAEDARAVDAPSGEFAQGRDAIRGGWQYVFAQGGSWNVDRVVADGRSAAVMSTWTGTDPDGTPISAAWVMILEVRDGLIVSHLDVYDAASFPF